MNNNIEIHRNKSLRLDNVLIKDIFNLSLTAETAEHVAAQDESSKDLFSLELEVEKMNNEILVKGAKQIGPLIQYSGANGKAENIEIIMSLMLQADRYLTNVNPPYRMESVISVKDCMYTRFKGYEDDIQFAYQKIQVEAYENNIKLNGSSYTIFLDSDDDGTVTVDIFMEKADA